MEIKIEKGVPLVGYGGNRSSFMQVIRAMEVGDSFVYPKVKRANLGGYFARVPACKYITRSIDAENVRVWRVA